MSRVEIADSVLVNQPATSVGGEHLERQPHQITVLGQQQAFATAECRQERIEERRAQIPSPGCRPRRGHPSFSADANFNGIDPQTGRGQGFLLITVTPVVGRGNLFQRSSTPYNIQLAIRLIF